MWCLNEVQIAQIGSVETDDKQNVKGSRLGCRIVASRAGLDALSNALHNEGVPCTVEIQEDDDSGALYFAAEEYDAVMKCITARSLANAVPTIRPLPRPLLNILELAPRVVSNHVDGDHLCAMPDWAREGGVRDEAWTRLKPYQRAGVEFMYRRSGRVLLGDGMGLGKTSQAVVGTCLYRRKWPVLVISPSSVRYNLAKEFRNWAHLQDHQVIVIEGERHLKDLFPSAAVVAPGKKRTTRPTEPTCMVPTDQDVCVYVVSYDLVSRPGMLSCLLARQFRVLVCDESHYLKHMTSKRTRCVLQLAWKARHVLLLSGTPGVSPAELYPQLLALQPQLWPDWWLPPRSQIVTHEIMRALQTGQGKQKLECSFAARWCDPQPQRVAGGRFEYMLNGSARTEELYAIGGHFCFLQRRKEDVLLGLPPKRRERISFAVPEKDRLEIESTMEEMRGLRETNKIRYRTLFSRLFNQLPLLKIPFVRQFLDSVFSSMTEHLQDNDSKNKNANALDKVLIFGHHKAMMELIETRVRAHKLGYIMITGATPAKSRQSLVDRFQTDPDYRVAVLSLTAAGVGLNLFAACRVIIVEMLFGPDVLLQAEDRSHRLGQTREVLVQYLTASATLDEVVWRVVQRKQTTAGQLMTNKAGHFIADATQHIDETEKLTELIVESAPRPVEESED